MMESIRGQMDAKASTLRWAAGQYHASEKQSRSLTGVARKFIWNKAGLLSRWAQSGLQQAKGGVGGFLNNPLSLIDRLKEMLLTIKEASLSQQLKPFEEDPRIASLLHIMNHGSVEEKSWARDQLSEIAHAISEIARSQVAYNIYEKYGNTAYMEGAKQHAELQRSLLKQLGIDERYFVGTDLRAQFTGSPISALEFNPLLTDGSEMPDQDELRFVIAAGLVNEKYRHWAKLNYNEIELAVKRAEAIREFERQVEEYRRLHGPPMELPDGTPITPDNKENETTFNYFMEKVYDPNKPNANGPLEYYVWLEDTYGMTEWRKKVVMADRVAYEFVFALVEETVMGVVGTAEFVFKLVVDPENTVEGVVKSVAYLAKNPEVLVEAAKTMYKNFNEGTPEERAQMLGSAASYLIPGVTLTKAGKAVKVMDGLQKTAKAADKAKDINKLLEAQRSFMDLLPFTILRTDTGHQMIVPKDFSRNLQKHESPDVGGSGGRLEGTGQAGKPVVDKERLLGSLQNTENFKQGTKENGLSHIFDGEILKNGNANGFHYEGMPNSNGKIVGNVDPPNEFGVYQANVEINGVLKGPKSTFFPKEWTPQQVIDSVNEAFNNKVNIINNKYIGKTSTGMEIEFILRNDKIISAYPIY
ncbi:EndoU domain-containing protein [Paenibacillus ihumii]|uniref:EndoU domain-containing protein n=1 Tax=Paenibacillus ihumii TaxID=687436 RepID=UPI001E40D5D7|nr:EndoU domain-containing protein [Paenibacillus ihumii]